MTALPLDPVVTVPVANATEFLRIRIPSVAFGTLVVIVAYRAPPERLYVIDETCAAAAMTFTVALPLTTPADAVIVAAPVAEGVKVADDPLAGVIVPLDADHAIVVATALPNASAPLAVNVCVVLNATLAVAGVTFTVASAPAFTVSLCVPDWSPDAAAVRIGAPAAVSR
jgi:hypothetical protein